MGSKPSRQAKTRKQSARNANRPGGNGAFTPPQVSFLALLTLVAVLALFGLGFTVIHGEWNFLMASFIPTQNQNALETGQQPAVSELAMATITDSPPAPAVAPSASPSAMPTITSSPTLANPTATATLPSTQTDTPSPVPSLTPIPSLTPVPYHRRLIIGASAEGRPIEVVRFGNGHIQRMIIAGIHGGYEWNTIALADELIDYYQNHPEKIPSNTSLFILRSLNPDGEARGRGPDARTNANGVDLNRNWDANWTPNWSRVGCWNLRPTTAGAYPGSEPETQAVMQFLLSHKVDYLINYHSAALGIFPSGTPHHPASIHLAEAIGAITPYPYPPVDTGCIYSGTLVDWALKHSIIGVDLELQDHSNTDFTINLKVLDLLLTWSP